MDQQTEFGVLKVLAPKHNQKPHFLSSPLLTSPTSKSVKKNIVAKTLSNFYSLQIDLLYKSVHTV